MCPLILLRLYILAAKNPRTFTQSQSEYLADLIRESKRLTHWERVCSLILSDLDFLKRIWIIFDTRHKVLSYLYSIICTPYVLAYPLKIRFRSSLFPSILSGKAILKTVCMDIRKFMPRNTHTHMHTFLGVYKCLTKSRS